MSAWTDHVDRWRDCQLCPLCKQRDRIVLARGQIPADALFVGEAPGASEDAIGLPFVGPAGRLLDQIIEQALPATVRYALTNLVCCFPAEAKARGDNEPSHKEILACRPRLVEFVNVAQPRLIVCVGLLALRYVDLLSRKEDTVRVIEITHPAAILRMPLAQRDMETRKSVVVLRNAVEGMPQGECPKFTKWGDDHAGVATHNVRKQQLSNARYDDDIPF